MAVGSAFSSGFVVNKKDRPKDGPKFQYFVLIQEMEKRSISPSRLALALAVTPNVLRGASSRDFPLEKLDLLIELLNNWTGPTTNRQAGPLGKPVMRTQKLRPVTRDMLVIG
jgi:hypothetical protein